MGPIGAIEPPRHNKDGQSAVAPGREADFFQEFFACCRRRSRDAAHRPAALAQVSDDVVKIGVLTDMNGPASTPTGQGSVTAAQMAIDDFGGKVLGKPITVISGDHQLKADIGSAIARRWYDTDQVDLIVDVPVSAVGLAVQTSPTKRKNC
jgi:ABC-type branched-subunit amino acid transport system substrate-binding protein